MSLATCPICGCGMIGDSTDGWVDTYDGLPHDPDNHNHGGRHGLR